MSQSPTSPLTVVLVDIRSAHNVGAIWRTADAVDVAEMILVGITPHPEVADDPRPGHIIARHEREIAKSALGAEKVVPFSYFSTIDESIACLASNGFYCYAVECNRSGAIDLFSASLTPPTALFFGSETNGLSQLDCDKLETTLKIPMYGSKTSLNVAVAAGIAMYAAKAALILDAQSAH